MLATTAYAKQVFDSLVPKVQCFGRPLCLHSEHANNIVIQLREIDPSQVTAEIFAIVNSKDNL